MSERWILVTGYGSIGRRHFQNLRALGNADVRLLRTRSSAPGSFETPTGVQTYWRLDEALSDGPGAFHEWARRSLESFPSVCHELKERTGIDPELEVCGALYPASDADAEARLRGKQRMWPDAGLEWLDARAAGDCEPALAAGGAPGARAQPGAAERSSFEALRGALFAPAEAHVRSPLLARAYAGAAAGLGARIERGVTATGLLRAGPAIRGVETSAGPRPAGAVVLCGGAWTPELLALPVEPVRGQIVSLDNPDPPGFCRLPQIRVFQT